MGRSDFRDRPMSAALVVVRKSRRLMADVFPVLVVEADQDLVVELVGRDGEWRHVGWKLEERGEPSYVDEAETSGQRCRRIVVVLRCEDETPFAEGWDVDVVRISLEAGLFEGVGDAPERVAREHWRSALDDDHSLRAEMAGDGAVEGGGIELAEGVIRWVGKVDDDEIETIGVGVDPREGVGVDDVKFGRE